MKAKLVVFPIRGRNWCFTRSIDPSMLDAQSSNTPSTFKELWGKLFSGNKSSDDSKIELTVDFAANKMNRAWSNLEKAPEGTLKNKIHGFGVKLLSRVKPSEIFLRSIPKEINSVEIVYPSSLNPRMVRRRLRHVAFRGAVIHKRYFYGSAIFLPLTSVFMVLPLPNVPFFWVLFRAYSHWRASQGSEKLLDLVTDASSQSKQSDEIRKEQDDSSSNPEKKSDDFTGTPWVLQPSEELERLLRCKDSDEGVSDVSISEICKIFYLNSADIVKYRHSM